MFFQIPSSPSTGAKPGALLGKVRSFARLRWRSMAYYILSARYRDRRDAIISPADAAPDGREIHVRRA